MKAFFILTVLMLWGCDAQIERPEMTNIVIPSDSMSLLLEEIIPLEGHIQNEYNHVSRFAGVMDTSLQLVLKRYNIDTSRYIHSVKYYSNHQGQLIEIYQSLQSKFEKEITHLEK